MSQALSQPAPASDEIKNYHVKEFCEKFRVSRATVSRAASDGRIKVIRFGRRVLIPHAEALRIASEGIASEGGK
jgi:excisionase family DNA binding protein